MKILGLLGMHFDAVVVEVKIFYFLIMFALAILWMGFSGQVWMVDLNFKYRIDSIGHVPICCNKQKSIDAFIFVCWFFFY